MGSVITLGGHDVEDYAGALSAIVETWTADWWNDTSSEIAAIEGVWIIERALPGSREPKVSAQLDGRFVRVLGCPVADAAALMHTIGRAMAAA